MSFHIAPLIRSMEEARQTVGLLPAGNGLDTVGYTVRKAQEGVTQPTPIITPNGGIGNFWFTGVKTTPTL
jgi:hypothetical protein